MAEYSENYSTRPGHYVYRCWDADGVALYVGVCGQRRSKRVSQRLIAHKGKPWWPLVARVDVASFGTGDEAAVEEEAQITALNPAHNQKLLGYCARGHDLTLPNARMENNNWQCRKCYNRYRRIAGYDLAANQSPKARARKAAYHKARNANPVVAARRAMQKRASSRRPSPGQNPLW